MIVQHACVISDLQHNALVNRNNNREIFKCEGRESLFTNLDIENETENLMLEDCLKKFKKTLSIRNGNS